MDFSQLHVTTPSVKVTQGDVKVTRGDATGLWCRMVTSGTYARAEVARFHCPKVERVFSVS